MAALLCCCRAAAVLLAVVLLMCCLRLPEVVMEDVGIHRLHGRDSMRARHP